MAKKIVMVLAMLVLMGNLNLHAVVATEGFKFELDHIARALSALQKLDNEKYAEVYDKMQYITADLPMPTVQTYTNILTQVRAYVAQHEYLIKIGLGLASEVRVREMVSKNPYASAHSLERAFEFYQSAVEKYKNDLIALRLVEERLAALEKFRKTQDLDLLIS